MLLKPKERAAIDGKGDTKALVAKLDRVFSKYIRLRDTFAFGAGDRAGHCCTCEGLFSYSELDCGHFIGRQHFGTRWDPENCHAQCRKENRFEEGRKDLFAEYLGEEVVNRLEIKKKLNSKKPSAFELQQKIKYYTAKVKGLSV